MLRQTLFLAALALLLCGCVGNPNDDSLERMQRNHHAAVETAA